MFLCWPVSNILSQGHFSTGKQLYQFNPFQSMFFWKVKLYEVPIRPSDISPARSREMSSAASSSWLRRQLCTSILTSSLIAWHERAKDLALLTPRRCRGCPICRWRLLKATVSASTKPRRPTPDKDLKFHGSFLPSLWSQMSQHFVAVLGCFHVNHSLLKTVITPGSSGQSQVFLKCQTYRFKYVTIPCENI